MRIRNRSGAAIFFLCLILGCIALPLISFFAFEVVRATAVKDQLRAICQAAALSGAARLASSDEADTAVTHQNVVDACLETFRANSIYERGLFDAFYASSKTHNPSGNCSSLFVELLDPNSTPAYQPVPMGDTRGTVVHTVGAYGLSPLFGSFLGIGGPFTIRAEGHSRVPQLDIVLCFDVSGSIDDETPVTFVKRYWATNPGRIQYAVSNSRSGAGNGGFAQGTLLDVLLPPPSGTGVNGMPPQNLDEADSSANDGWLTFSRTLRGSPNTGSPPGNYPSGNGTGNAYTFTDLVVNISSGSSGCLLLPWTSPGGFYYPNLETVVEAARGNLDSVSAFNGAKLSTVPGLVGVAPRPGYRDDYLANARLKIEPLRQAQIAAREFFTIMNNNTEAHFGFVSFASEAGVNPGDTVSAPNVSSDYSAGGTGRFPRPGVSLDPASTGYASVSSAVDITVANGGTNMGDALYRARQMLVQKRRPGSRRAVILFSDGHPTAPGTGTYPFWYARSLAYQLKDEGIPIYTIGLAQNPDVVPGQCDILNDDPYRTVLYTDSKGIHHSYTPGPANEGISYIAGNGGKFFLVMDASHLRLTFENIARQMVQITAEN
ncbi:MAG: VWA domain-containing protein [Candidatus Obscuribacterales bacterium]